MSQFTVNNQYIRDLQWIFQSPPMLDFGGLSFEQKRMSSVWLNDLIKSAASLESHLRQKNLKMLGPYFEGLWEYYLTHSKTTDLLAKNLQVFDNGQTLGEFDFIYFDREIKKAKHLEVAVKYYLGCFETKSHSLINPATSCLASKQCTSLKQYTPMNCWIGPNANDRLDKKYLKMLEHQSNLSKTQAGQYALSKIGVSEVIPEICLLGYLFYPCFTHETEKLSYPLVNHDKEQLGKFGSEFGSPENVNNQHVKGSWLRYNQSGTFFAQIKNNQTYAQILWGILTKPHWLASVMRFESDLYSIDQIQLIITEHFTRSSKPMLIAPFKSEDVADSSTQKTYYSQSPIFIVNDLWPDKRIKTE